uniref:TCP domain-containing protein n=1 Tax=Ananas comosus var. bracteatus TaxID=296719 RepID=A0A6V7PNV4_ANACO|nr:unnamed protein product [Ananas comosus var. bracteatus]
MLIREGASLTKQESILTDGKAPTSTTQVWFRNPRIVRVSRGFKGKDRHSKVTTVRGLKDRRIRLSVLTAIQLYDLQDKLGLNQPSKVVDWLLNAAQHEIDKLPPLQMPPGNFIQFPQMAPRDGGNCSTHEAVIETIHQQLTASSSMANNSFFNNNVSEDLMTISNGDVHMGIKPKGNYINILGGNDTENQIAETYTPYHQWGSSDAWMSQSGSHSSQEESAHVSDQAPKFALTFDAKQHNYFQIANLQLSQNLFDHINLNTLQETMKNN